MSPSGDDVAWLIIGLLAVLGGLLLIWARGSYRNRFDVDVLVIGGGAAGLTAAGMAARLGAKTALIENARLGGDCTWCGCVPSKALLAAAAAVQSAREADRFGLGTAELEVDLKAVLDRVRAIQQQIYEDADRPEIFEGFGVDVRKGRARFLGPHRVAITHEGGSEELSFRWCVIGTGSRPRRPSIPGLDEVAYLTNETLFSLERLPEHLVVLGGGPVGVEMAQAFRRLGSRVTLLDRGERLLSRDDPALVAILTTRLRKEGVDIRLDTDLVRVTAVDGAITVTVRHDDHESTLAADRLLVAIGREPNTDALDLDRAGVTHHEAGIVIDAACRTSQRHIFASGDVAGGPKFTHWAEQTSKTAITNAVLGVPARVDPDSIVWTTFTEPELAHCGKRATDLDDYQLYRFPYAKLDRAVAQRQGDGMVHVYADGGTILGASAVGHAAGEIVSELALAMQNGISLRKLADSLHAYPGWSLGARRVADQWYIQNTPVGWLRRLGRLRGLRGNVPDVDPDEIV